MPYCVCESRDRSCCASSVTIRDPLLELVLTALHHCVSRLPTLRTNLIRRYGDLMQVSSAGGHSAVNDAEGARPRSVTTIAGERPPRRSVGQAGRPAVTVMPLRDRQDENPLLTEDFEFEDFDEEEVKAPAPRVHASRTANPWISGLCSGTLISRMKAEAKARMERGDANSDSAMPKPREYKMPVVFQISHAEEAGADVSPLMEEVNKESEVKVPKKRGFRRTVSLRMHKVTVSAEVTKAMSIPPEERSERQKLALLKFSTSHEAFSKLPPRISEMVASYLIYENYSPNTVLMRQGDEGSEMYVIFSGDITVLISKNPKLIPRNSFLAPAGSMIGEMASTVILKTRTATLVTRNLCELGKLHWGRIPPNMLKAHTNLVGNGRSESAYFQSLQMDPAQGRTESELNILSDLMQCYPFFAQFSTTALLRICRSVFLQEYPKNHVIFIQGQENTQLQVIMRGSVMEHQAGRFQMANNMHLFTASAFTKNFGPPMSAITPGDGFGASQGTPQCPATYVTQDYVITLCIESHIKSAIGGQKFLLQPEKIRRILLKRVASVVPQDPKDRHVTDVTTVSEMANSSSFFGTLNRKRQKYLCQFGRYTSLRKGELLYLQGDEGAEGSFYLVVSGSICLCVLPNSLPDLDQVLAFDPEKTSVSAVFGPRASLLSSGAGFGELSLISGFENADSGERMSAECGMGSVSSILNNSFAAGPNSIVIVPKYFDSSNEGAAYEIARDMLRIKNMGADTVSLQACAMCFYDTTGLPRIGSAVANEYTQLMVVSRDVFEDSITEEEKQEAKDKMHFIEAHAPHIIQNYPKHGLAALFYRLERRSIPAKTVICREGKPLDGLGFLASGEVKLVMNVKPADSGATGLTRLEVAKINVGEYFGEFSFMGEQGAATPAPYDIIAYTKLVLYHLPTKAKAIVEEKFLQALKAEALQKLRWRADVFKKMVVLPTEPGMIAHQPRTPSAVDGKPAVLNLLSSFTPAELGLDPRCMQDPDDHIPQAHLPPYPRASLPKKGPAGLSLDLPQSDDDPPSPASSSPRGTPSTPTPVAPQGDSRQVTNYVKRWWDIQERNRAWNEKVLAGISEGNLPSGGGHGRVATISEGIPEDEESEQHGLGTSKQTVKPELKMPVAIPEGTMTSLVSAFQNLPTRCHVPTASAEDAMGLAQASIPIVGTLAGSADNDIMLTMFDDVLKGGRPFVDEQEFDEENESDSQAESVPKVPLQISGESMEFTKPPELLKQTQRAVNPPTFQGRPEEDYVESMSEYYKVGFLVSL
eukprot:gene2395-3125_t